MSAHCDSSLKVGSVAHAISIGPVGPWSTLKERPGIQPILTSSPEQLLVMTLDPDNSDNMKKKLLLISNSSQTFDFEEEEHHNTHQF